jgi:DMSO/TMAO reductase YedYZ molybdopterin-dependent catalytic subunit
MRRRAFLQGALLTGCSSPAPPSGPPSSAACEGDPLAGGSRLGVVPFVDEGPRPAEVLHDAGLDARLYTDLSTLDERGLVVDTARFYVRTGYPDRLDPSRPWTIALGGAVRAAVSLPIADLARDEAPMGATLLECSGNGAFAYFGLMSVAEWSGVPLPRVLERVERLPEGKRVLVSGFDDHSRPSARSVPGASWIFGTDDLVATGAFLATRMNGAPLTRDHGAPVRLVVPGWYGCTCIKWVDAIDVVGDDAPSTPHMREFASRTHQVGEPALARDFRPASMDLAAMPIRVERWSVAGQTRCRVVGIQWGGAGPTDKLLVRFGESSPWERVASCAPPAPTRIWSFWSHVWTPPGRGVYAIDLRVDDAAVPTRRLDRLFYRRRVAV